MCFLSMYSLLKTLSEYICFYISKNITSCTFLLVFKIVKSLQCNLKMLKSLKIRWTSTNFIDFLGSVFWFQNVSSLSFVILIAWNLQIFLKWKLFYIESKEFFCAKFFLGKTLSKTITHCLRCVCNLNLAGKSVSLIVALR